MINRFITKLVERYGILHTVQAAMAASAVIFFTAAALRLFVPLNMEPIATHPKSLSQLSTPQSISELLDKDNKPEAIAYRPGMFRPATGLRDKPLADKTIERIKNQLTLQCVMEMNGEPVAYINIKGTGLKKCCVGENINDLFTVLNIDKQNKNVEISIVKHKITLHL